MNKLIGVNEMYDKNLVRLGQKVQFLDSYDTISNSIITAISTKDATFSIASGHTFTRKTGKQKNNRVGKIISMTHFK